MLSKQESKEEVYKAVLNAAIELDIQHGSLNWTYTQLSKKSEISRSLIYYYFGKDKINILKEACHLFGQVLAGNTEERMQAWIDEKIENGLIATKALLTDYPYLTPYYFLNRSKDNEIGELIRFHEEEGFKKRKHFFPKMTESEQRIMFSFHLGLVTFPYTKNEDIALASDVIQNIFKN